jgi:hypothetical protein
MGPINPQKIQYILVGIQLAPIEHCPCVFSLGNVKTHYVFNSHLPFFLIEFCRYFFHVLLPTTTIQEMPKFFSIW